MAKAEKKTAKKEKVVEKETAAPEFKYGVKDIADELGIKETSVRVQLRNKGIEKSGKSYGWNSKAELKEVIAALRSSTKDDEDEDEAPAKKSKKAKAEKAKPAKAKKAKSKKARDEEDENEDDD